MTDRYTFLDCNGWYTSLDRYVSGARGAAVNRLAEYENTGLEPKEIVKLKAERDAAIRDFTEYTQAWWNEERRFPCEWCKHNDTPFCRNVEKINSEKPCAGRFFEWRGPQQEET